jgi:hypothetical protein
MLEPGGLGANLGPGLSNGPLEGQVYRAQAGCLSDVLLGLDKGGAQAPLCRVAEGVSLSSPPGH